jgi:hypothetical protein
MSNLLPITNVVTISVSQTSPGVGQYNTSNLALFTDEAPATATFGTLGYNQYLTPTQVGIDFGTSSRTFAMANAVFSQQPNILNGGGQLVVIPLTNQVVNLAFSGIPASGSFVINYGGNASSAINATDSISTIQTKINAVSGLSQVSASGSLASQSINITMSGIYSPTAITITSNSLITSGSGAITVTVTTPTAAQKLGAAITAASSVVQFFGIMANENIATIGQTDLLAAAAIIQPLNKIGFFVSNQSADLNPGGNLDLLRSGSFTQSRGLYYGDPVSGNGLNMMAAYAALGLSVNFNGSNTTTTMHLKTLSAINVDPTITQTQLNLAQTCGADCYVSLQGVPAVFTSGANSFFDAVYNLQWLVGALQVAGFNYLAQSGTKIPQTENGMDGLKGAYRSVMQQAVTNQYLAPGSWTSSTTFGNQAQLIANIANIGYYIYSVPVSQQLAAARAARQAPLIQIAAKQAGAIQSSNVIVTVNS